MNWNIASAELVIGLLILISLTVDLLTDQSNKKSLWKIPFAGLVVLGITLIAEKGLTSYRLGDMFVLDSFSFLFKWFFLLTMAAVILMSKVFSASLKNHIGEWYILLLSSLLGMFVLASANDLLLVFIGIELLTFSLYVMAAYLKTDRHSIEAGMKYLIIGSLSSGVFIYGVSLIYGVAGGTSFESVKAVFETGEASLIAKSGMMLILCGLGFKMAAVPFHFWAPDVYEGAPTPVVALLSVGSKMAGAMILIRLLYGIFFPAIQIWSGAIAIICALTMCYGNLSAIAQTNIKRLLGYSSIGQAGYLLMGLASGSGFGIDAVGYYLLAYLFANLAVFFVVVLVEQELGNNSLEAYNGLSKRSPLLAACIFVGLLSLAGVPPLAGFIGKLLVLLSSAQSGHIWLLSIGAINVAISLYYYLMVVRRMYAIEPASSAPIKIDVISKTALLILVIGTVMIGLFQEPFLQIISEAINLPSI